MAAAEKYPRGPGRSRIVWFLLISALINAAGAVSGYWIRFPKPEPQKEAIIDLTNINDAPPLLQPEDQPETPPDPEPTPPPEPEPTPPPLDKPPEFEVPEPTPTPTPPPQPAYTPKPKPTPAPKTEVKHPPSTVPATAPHGTNPPNASPNGVVGGTGTGGPRSSNLLRSPSPPYPPQALQMHITGNVRVTMHVSNGVVTDAEGSGPPMLATAAARWVRANWKFAPGISGVTTLPVTFVIH
jgi:outer membrane biosynthesis protein TonB